MKQEILKKLWEAGYPVTVGLEVKQDEVVVTREFEPTSVTLSALIEACGDRFNSLGMRTGSTNNDYKRWAASALCKSLTIGWNPVRTQGDTPKEAVANLWLELNKK